jgi:hypothetical protein
MKTIVNCVILQTIKTLVDRNAKHIDGDYTLWLADNYDTLPDYIGESMPATVTPVDPAWRSHFLSKTIPDVVAYMRATPKPPKPLNKTFCAVLTKEGLELGQIFICKSLEGEPRLESDSEDEDVDELVDEYMDGTPAYIPEPGSFEELLSSNAGEGPDDVRIKKRRTIKQALRALDDDYEGIQVIPTDEDKVGEFHYIFPRYRWQESYIKWHEDGVGV